MRHLLIFCFKLKRNQILYGYNLYSVLSKNKQFGRHGKTVWQVLIIKDY